SIGGRGMKENKLKLLKELLESFKSSREVHEPFVMSFEDETDDALEWAIEQTKRVQKLEEIRSDAIDQIDVTQRRNERLEQLVQELEMQLKVSNSVHADDRKLLNRRTKQNERYRELLEMIQKMTVYDDCREAEIYELVTNELEEE